MNSRKLVHYDLSYKRKKKRMERGFTFAQKRNLTLFAFSMRMLFMGVEYAVIFPSVWLYLKIFHVDYWYLGLVLSAYNMVGIVSTILVGRLADATRKIRLTGFLWNLAEIAGNFVYALHFHFTLPLLGRMVAGFGEGYISAMWGELARVTKKEQRTRYFAILKGSNLLGAAIGPGLNLFLKEFDFHIGRWHIDFRTSPGFFMGLVWIIVTLVMIVFVYDLSSEMNAQPGYKRLVQEESDNVDHDVGSLLSGAVTPEEPDSKRAPGDRSDDGAIEQAKELTERADETGLPTKTADLTKSATFKPDEMEANKPVTFRSAFVDMFSKFEVNVLVYLLFFMYVTHTCLQGITPLVAERMLKWSETKVSIVYTVWGLEIIVVLIIVWLVSPKIQDRIILLTAVICGALASVSLIVLSYSTPESSLCYYSFLVTIFLGGVGISITVVVGRSLVSKHTKPENQGLVHAILTSFNRLAGLSGPIFGSSLYTHKTVMGCLIGGVQFLGLILLLVAFKRLKVVNKS